MLDLGSGRPHVVHYTIKNLNDFIPGIMENTLRKSAHRKGLLERDWVNEGSARTPLPPFYHDQVLRTKGLIIAALKAGCILRGIAIGNYVSPDNWYRLHDGVLQVRCGEENWGRVWGGWDISPGLWDFTNRQWEVVRIPIDTYHDR